MKTIHLWKTVPGMCEEVPVLEYYPAENKTTNAAVIILPGGGYCMRAEHEGKGYAEYLNALGMDAFVCEYRVAPHRHPLPLMDARRAVQYVRFSAKNFGLNPEKIGIMGSSAGGHLAASLCTLQDDFSSFITEKDEIDDADYLPNFQILCYPVIALNDFGHIGSIAFCYSKTCIIPFAMRCRRKIMCTKKRRKRSFGTRRKTAACRFKTA